MRTYAALNTRIATRLIVLSAGAAVWGIGGLTAFGYLLGIVRFYQWHHDVAGMSPNSALAFILTGIALTTLGASDRIWRC